MKFVISLFAWVVAIAIAVGQQKAIDRRHQEDRRRKLSASRAMLPLALSQLQAYVDNALDFFVKHYPADDISLLLVQGPKLIEASMPEKPMDIIEKNIEGAETNVVPKIAYLVKCMQIQNTRMRKELARTRPLSQEEIDSIIYDLLFLQTLIEAFYRYGRQDDEDVNLGIDVSSIHTAAIFRGLEQHASLTKKIDRGGRFGAPPISRALFFRSYSCSDPSWERPNC